jgi:hypothetical protein
MSNLVRTVLVFAAFGLASAVIVTAINWGEISRVTGPVKQVTPENFTGIKDITTGQIIQITGTPDVLNAVSMEGRNDNLAVYYYVPLKEYGTNFIIRVKKTKLNSSPQSFTGQVIGLTQTEYDARIRTALNKPVTLTDTERAELDTQTINDLTEQTTNNFSGATLLVLEGEIPDPGVTVSNVIFWSFVLFIVLTTTFRKFVFTHLYTGR